MATVQKKEHRCPQCGNQISISMHASILPGEHPELKKSILSETLFSFTCPHCGYQADFVYPVLYHDREQEYMIYLSAHPEAALSHKIPQELCEVRKRVAGSLKELKEKILIFDAGLDDAEIEIVKFAVLDVIAKNYGDENVSAYFLRMQEDGIVFAVYFSGYAEPVLQTAGLALLASAQEMLKRARYEEKNRFIRVDQALAQNLISQAK